MLAISPPMKLNQDRFPMNRWETTITGGREPDTAGFGRDCYQVAAGGGSGINIVMRELFGRETRDMRSEIFEIYKHRFSFRLVL
ncbi:hypothetical protein TNCT_596471 [Trichonephila clavata]|uniref:Uncharacterized protein n=1 Tax=Trichonephila clavata TaxID=2740835 RepID=A0A8X6HBG3_TRICU|nr:hypothetical protein TNCT_596471 [Trichonephila clavata]